MRITEKLLQVTAQEYYNDKKKTTIAEQEKLLRKLRCVLSNRFFSFATYKNDNIKQANMDGKSCETLLARNNLFLFQRSQENKDQYDARVVFWQQLYHIHQLLHQHTLTLQNQEEISVLIKCWCHVYVARFTQKNVTNSIHVLFYHVIPYICLYGSLSPFSQQGVEMGVRVKKKLLEDI